MKTIIVGAGNWGTTLARVFAEKCPVSLWTTTAEHAGEINRHRENRRYLRGIALPPGVRATAKFRESVASDDLIVIAVPSHQVRSVAGELRGAVSQQPVVCASKGFEHTSLKTMSEVTHDELPQVPIVVLSGPNIAREVAEGKPSKAVLASKDFAAVKRVASVLKNDQLSFDICRDVRGVELCAALKGIIAIGVGLADGLGLGSNVMGLLMTYGLKEFVAIAEFFGIAPKTIYGIAGLGDLIATCLSHDSRNRRFGSMLARGENREAVLTRLGMVVEGVQMAKTISELDDLNVPIPLFATIAHIIFEPNGDMPHRFISCLTTYKYH